MFRLQECFAFLRRDGMLFKISVFGFEGTKYLLNGPVAQLVRASPCHGEGRRFESDLGRYMGS